MQHSPENLYIFEGLSPQEINYFVMMSEPVEFRSGETIVSEGGASDGRAYFVQSGMVEISRKGRSVAVIGPGELFGEIALITDEPRTATAKARENVSALAFRKDEFAMLLDRTDLRLEIMRRIRENLRSDHP